MTACTTAPVSVVIPCYRCAATVGRAVASIAAQALRPTEIILVDDCSGDGTLTVLRDLSRLYGSNWITVVPLVCNMGASAARNSGWELAKQPYVAFLDADDAWHPRKIELQYTWMLHNPDVSITGHRCLFLDPRAALPATKVDDSFGAQRLHRFRLLLSNPCVTPSLMARRDLCVRFNPATRYAEDHEFLMRAALGGFSIAMLQTELCYVFKRLGQTGSSRQLFRMRQGNILSYWHLWRLRRLDLASAVALSVFSAAKFLVLLMLGPSRYEALSRLLNWRQRRQ